MVLALIAMAGGAVLGVFAAVWTGLGTSAATAFALCLSTPLFLLVLWFGLGVRGGWTIRDLGFRRPRHSLWHLLWWIPASIVLSGIGAMVLGSALGLSPSDGTSSTRDALSLHWSIAPLAALATAVVIPLAEEIVFRRVLLDWLMTKMPTVLAVIITIIVFALVHVSPTAMAYLIFLSASLVLARLWFRSLWAPFLIHAANNGLITVAALAALIG